VVIAVIIALALRERKRKREHLRERFGPEYEREVEERGRKGKAESELERREKRRERMEIRPLEPAARERYVASWGETQARFVDDPDRAVGEADVLVIDVMRDRGYPVDDFEQRASDVSVDHPHVVENYRSAHGIAERHRRGDATTEELRRALQHYRALFDDLLKADERGGGRSEGRDDRRRDERRDEDGGGSGARRADREDRPIRPDDRAT